MAKRKAVPKKKPNPLAGCAFLIFIGVAVMIGLNSNRGTSPRTVPTPNGATRDAVSGTAKVIALTPSATITDTPQPVIADRSTVTARPEATIAQIAVTPFNSTVYYVRSSANARTCPDTACASLGQFEAGEYIGVDGLTTGATISGSRRWYRTQYDGQAAFVHDSLLIEGALVAGSQSQAGQQSQSVPPAQPPAAQGFTCPSNCAGAVEMGLSAEQAATCPGLDRDKDGMACYGD